MKPRRAAGCRRLSQEDLATGSGRRGQPAVGFKAAVDFEREERKESADKGSECAWPSRYYTCTHNHGGGGGLPTSSAGPRGLGGGRGSAGGGAWPADHACWQPGGHDRGGEELRRPLGPRRSPMRRPSARCSYVGQKSDAPSKLTSLRAYMDQSETLGSG